MIDKTQNLIDNITDEALADEDLYTRLLGLNVVVALILFGVITWALLRLLLRFRRKKFGSQLLAKLVAVFALVGLLPGLLIYGVSYRVCPLSIESWFDVRVEGALAAGVNLGRTALDTLSQDITSKVQLSARQLSSVADNMAALSIERIREQLSATDVQRCGAPRVSCWPVQGLRVSPSARAPCCGAVAPGDGGLKKSCRPGRVGGVGR